MFPMVSLGGLNISTFGVFLALGFLFGIFSVWRITRAWDMNEERVLDLTLLTFLGGILGARLYFILENSSIFGLSLQKWIFLGKYPGFSFWGALLGGFLTIKFFARRYRINFWQALDFASVGLLGGLIFESLGCFFGGCSLGIASKIFFAVPMVGAIGTRIPIQAIEAIILYLIFKRIWKFISHFHIHGTVATASLICIGLTKLILTPFEQNRQDGLLSLILVLTGILVFYKITKRKIAEDIKILGIKLAEFFKNPKLRKALLLQMKKNWYNYKVDLVWKVRFLSKFLRRINVRFSHKNSRYY